MSAEKRRTPGWVKFVAVVMGTIGWVVAVPPVIAAVLFLDSVNATSRITKIAPIADGGLVDLGSRDGNVTVVAGRDGEVVVDESFEVRSPTRQLVVDQIRLLPTTQLTHQSGGGVAIVVPAGLPPFTSRSVTIHVPAGAPLRIVGLSSEFHLIGLSGSLDLQTSTGSVTLEGESVRSAVHVQAIDTDVEFHGTMDGGQLEVTITHGSIDAFLPVLTTASLSATTVNGSITIDSQFSVPVQQLVFGEVATGAVRGGGSSTITLRSTNGNISVRVE